MKLSPRIKRLERKLLGNQEIWAVFKIGYYEDPCKEELTKNRLKSDYLSQGNPQPTHFLFIKEMPGLTKNAQEEVFLYSFSHWEDFWR